MLTTHRSRYALAGVIVLLLGLASTLPAQAAGHPSASSSRLWSWLSAWTVDLDPRLLTWLAGKSDDGPRIDPNGHYGPQATYADDGPNIDPNGRNRTSAVGNVDVGPTIDPNGRNGVQAPTYPDEGPNIDPNGGRL